MQNILDENTLKAILQKGEDLSTEFKSDRKQLSDNDIYECVVALANTQGGLLLIGVEDDGTVTEAKPRHGKTTDPARLQSAIFNNTSPNINTSIVVSSVNDSQIIVLQVEAYPEICATKAGKSLQRVIGPDGKPQDVPFYPSEQRSRRVDLGLLDFSAQVIEGSSFDDFEPLEFERLRKAIVSLRGDNKLLDANNEELAKALRLVETRGKFIFPNIAGILLLGKEESIKKFIPTHAVHFQIIDAQGNVKVNDTFRFSLLRIIEEIESRFTSRNEEHEVNVGLFRLPIPDYSPIGFREAVNNALLHRDYSRMDNIYIQWHHDHFLITSPGSFPQGITISNILVHEPKPRNPRLAEAFKRIGLVEQTGRGVDKIFIGQLRYGRPVPDYSRSDTTGVRVVIKGGKSSLEFASFVYQQEKSNNPLTLDELLILNALFYERRIDSDMVAGLIQKNQSEARATLEKLIEKGFIEAKGEKRGRIYHFSSSFYRKLGKEEGYVRMHGLSAQRCEALIMEYIDAHKRIERKHVMELCGLSGLQASRLLKKMCDSNKLKIKGNPPRWVYYEKK